MNAVARQIPPKSMTYQLLSGEIVSLQRFSDEILAFLHRVLEFARDESRLLIELIALVYSKANPLFHDSLSPGLANIGMSPVHPAQGILLDIVERKRRGQSK